MHMPGIEPLTARKRCLDMNLLDKPCMVWQAVLHLSLSHLQHQHTEMCQSFQHLTHYLTYLPRMMWQHCQPNLA